MGMFLCLSWISKCFLYFNIQNRLIVVNTLIIYEAQTQNGVHVARFRLQNTLTVLLDLA